MILDNIDLQWFGDESGETKRTRMTNESNESIARENLEYQREWNEYQKSLNEQIMQREDTAIQRQVADARAAGVSPLAASNVGQAQTGTSVQAGAPLNNSMRYESGANPVLEKLQAISSIVSTAGNISQQIQDLSTAWLRKDMLSAQLQGQRYSNDYRAGELYDRAYERSYNRHYGLTSNMSEKERLLRTLAVDMLGAKGSGSSVQGYLNPLDPNSAVSFPSPTHITGAQIKQFFSDENSPARQMLSAGTDTLKKVVETADNAMADVIQEVNDKVRYKAQSNYDPQHKTPKQIGDETRKQNARANARKKISQGGR